MLKIGLTGGIGSGKTVVAKVFSVLGIPVFDADKEAKLIMENDNDLINLISNTFGNECYTNGKLNRPHLATLVFNDSKKLKQLNAIVHPATIASAEKWFEEQTGPYAIKEAALLFEAGSAASLDYIIGVSAPPEIRMQRVMERDKISMEDVSSRIIRQMDDLEKMRLCDFVIENDDRKCVIEQVLHLNDIFLASKKAKGFE